MSTGVLMSETLKDLKQSAKELLDNAKAIKGPAFARDARLLHVVMSLRYDAIHASTCVNPICRATTTLRMTGLFNAFLLTLSEGQSEADQKELANLVLSLREIGIRGENHLLKKGLNDGN